MGPAGSPSLMLHSPSWMAPGTEGRRETKVRTRQGPEVSGQQDRFGCKVSHEGRMKRGCSGGWPGDGLLEDAQGAQPPPPPAPSLSLLPQPLARRSRAEGRDSIYAFGALPGSGSAAGKVRETGNADGGSGTRDADVLGWSEFLRGTDLGGERC